MQLTQEQRKFIVETFFVTNNYPVVRNEFRISFPEREPPTKKSIKKLVEKFRTRGTVESEFWTFWSKSNNTNPRKYRARSTSDCYQPEY